MSDACAGRDTGKARVGDERDLLADVEVLQGGGHLVDLLHARAHRTAADEHHHLVGEDAVVAVALDGGNRRALAREHARRAGEAVHAVAADDGRVDCGALADGAIGREVAAEERDGGRQALCRRAVGGEDHFVGVHAVGLEQPRTQGRAAIGGFPPVEHRVERLAADGPHRRVEQSRTPQMQHHLGHAAGEVHAHGGVWAVGQHVHQARHAPVDRQPVVDDGTTQARRVRDGRHVQEQIGGAAKRCVHRHRVADGAVGQHVAGGDAGADHLRRRARRAARDVAPDRLPRRGERRMRHGKAERFGHNLRRRSGAEELAAAARRRTGAAAQFGGFLERELPVGVARADGLHGAGIDAVGGRQRHAARHRDGRHVVTRGQCHQHRRQALVARRDADHRAARGQRSDQPSQDQRRVVAVRQAVHHSGRSLGAAVARVGDKTGKREQARTAKRLGRRAHQQPDFPVPGVIAQCQRRAIRLAHAALSAEDEGLGTPQLRRLPAHAHVLRPAEDIAAGAVQQVVGRDGQRPGGAGLFGDDGVKGRVVGGEHGAIVDCGLGISDCGLRIGEIARILTSSIRNSQSAIRNSLPSFLCRRD